MDEPDQPCFRISEVAVDWQEPMVQECNAAATTRTMAAVNHTTLRLHPVNIHQVVPPGRGSTHPITAYCTFMDLERRKHWLNLIGWPVVDGLPTIVVTHQLQVERRTGKVCGPETDVLPLSHATNQVSMMWTCSALYTMQVHFAICTL